MRRTATLLATAAGLLAAIVAVSAQAPAPPAPSTAKYDLLLKGGHVIDARNSVDAVRDVAIKAARSRWSRASIPAADAGKTIDVAGLYVTPGLIDIHAHVYTGTGERGSYAGDNSVYPDGFSFRVGVTTRRRRRRLGLSQLRGLQGPRHRSVADARPGLPEHRRQRHARRQVREQPGRHGRRSRRRTWRSSTRASSSASRPRTTPDRSGRRSIAPSKPAPPPTSR